MSFSETLAGLKAAKSNIASAISAKGGTVHDGDGFSDFADDIGTIQTGGEYQHKTISQNGIYTPDDEYDAMDEVTVNVPIPVIPNEYVTGGSLADGTATFLKIADGVTEIKMAAFTGVSNTLYGGQGASLVEVQLPSTLTRIGDNAFNGCTHLRTINIPDSVNYIGAGAFSTGAYLPISSFPDAELCNQCFSRQASNQDEYLPVFTINTNGKPITGNYNFY